MALNVRFNQLTYASGNTAPNQDVFRYCDFPGERLIQRAKFEVNGNPLDEYTTEAYQYYRNNKVQPNKQDGYYRLVGQELPHEAHLEQQTLVQPNTRVAVDLYDGYQTPKGEHAALDVMVPLLFWLMLARDRWVKAWLLSLCHLVNQQYTLQVCWWQDNLDRGKLCYDKFVYDNASLQILACQSRAESR